MANKFKAPNMGIKPVNPISQERELMNLKRTTTPGYGPLTLPKQQPLEIHPVVFKKLMGMLGKKK